MTMAMARTLVGSAAAAAGDAGTQPSGHGIRSTVDVPMSALLATAAAVVATGFTATLVRSHLRRPRPYVAAWSVAMAMYSIATWALVVGTAGEWTELTFRAFYLFGAILNVLFLALGSAFLVAGNRVGTVLLVVFAAFGAGAAAVTLGAEFLAPLPASGVPAGSDVFAAPSEGITSPRLWALVANTIGTALLVGIAIYSIVRFRVSNRRLVRGNLIIVVGTLAPAVGGSLTALGEGGALALSLLAGAGLLWWGFLVASGGRSPAAAET